MSSDPGIKIVTARTIKWNSIDRLSSQVMYAVIGVILANVLTQEDFGLAGAIMVFQAFAILFVDSGFGASLLQQKSPTQQDYSTVFWFNLMVSVAVYAVLFFCAPLIADIFQGDRRLIPMSRVMFISFILNGLAIVQTNRLMKQMNVKQIAVSNLAGLFVSGMVGILLALEGYGAWALVWQAVVLAAVKSAWLWISTRWRPSPVFSRESLRKIYRVGLGVFSSSLLNTIFLNIYSFVIGAFYSLRSLGVYTQADKWSKMGSASLSQILTATFVPLLASVQDDHAQFHRYMRKINRFTAFIMFPFLGYLVVAATPIFHTLFGDKWDAAIPLFQILCIRGVFVVLVSLYNNYLLALGYARRIVVVEIIKDTATISAILLTVFLRSVEALVWGQMAASVVTFFIVHAMTSRVTGYRYTDFLRDYSPYISLTLAVMAVAYITGMFIDVPILRMTAELAVGAGLYYLVLWATGSRMLKDSHAYLTKKMA